MARVIRRAIKAATAAAALPTRIVDEKLRARLEGQRFEFCPRPRGAPRRVAVPKKAWPIQEPDS